MESQAEHIKCIMDAIEHGLTRAETLDECPLCATGLSVSESLRHDNMGWPMMPTALSLMS